MTMTHYDVIVIGAGAGGGVAAGVLAEAGKRILLLERGPHLEFSNDQYDHLRNQRFSRYGHNAGPEITGNPRVAIDLQGQTRIVRPHENGYHNNAAVVGGGTRVYGAHAWRFLPQDFQMASQYGVPTGSSLADWPISYDELEPYYERAEWDIGVAGDQTTMKHLPSYQKPYPMSLQPLNLQGQTARRGAQALGWKTVSIPLLINSVPY